MIICIILFLLIIGLAFVSRINAIENALPYPGHVDEIHLIKFSLKILKKGDFNPGFFNYPSLPVYITTFSMGFGFLSNVDKYNIRNTDEIEKMTYPYYIHSEILKPAKYIFAILSVLSMIFITLAGYYTFKTKDLLVLVPLILSTSAVFFYLSHQYLNVDIAGASFSCSVICTLCYSFKKDNFVFKSILPGILAGLTIACKYNLVLIMIPCILSILLFSKKRVSNVILFIIITIMTFITVVPFSILDFYKFINNVAYEVHHYKIGHPGYETQPGFKQFVHYVNVIINDYGSISIFFIIAGFIGMSLYDIRKTIVLYSFPSVFLFYMSMQQVNFLRNIVTLFIFYALFIAIGISFCYQLLLFFAKYIFKILIKNRVHRLNPFFKFILDKRLLATRLITVNMIVLLIPVILIFVNVKKLNNFAGNKYPDKIIKISNIKKWYNYPEDSRNSCIKWILANAKQGSIIILPSELNMNIENIEDKYRIIMLEYKLFTKESFISRIKKYENPLVLIPVFGYDKRNPGAKKISDRLNSIIDNFDSLIFFNTPELEFPEFFPDKKRVVLVNYFFSTPSGSPKLHICKLKNIRKEDIK